MRDGVDELERRIERRRHWYRVRTVFGLLSTGAMVLWLFVWFIFEVVRVIWQRFL